MLTLIPRRPEAELGPAAGQDVKRRHDLGQESRVAVGDPCDEQSEGHALREAGEEAE